MSVLTMETRLRGKHVLFILLGFFGIVFAVNGVFVYSALSTLPGEERGATYEAGLHYNTTLAGERSQEALHWSHKSQISAGSPLTVTVADADGSPVAGLAMEGWLERPASNSANRKLTFKEVDTGRYEATAGDADAGAWVLAFTAQKPRPGSEPAIYRVKERLWIGPAH
ncbi:MAG: FixH family protein [Rhodomicrobium sp.]